jgi:hypothetical protein
VVPQMRAVRAEQQQFDATRTPVNRLLSADAFAISAPIRMLTGGKYGASNLLEILPAYQGLAPAFAKGEADFARANEGALEAAAQAGESAMALPGLQELGAVEGGIAGTLKAMRSTRTANALNRLMPTADDASRTMGMSSVAQGSKNGFLPMDEASRMARAKEMWFRDMKLYHGTNADITEFDPSLGGRTSRSQAGSQGVWSSLSPDVAEDFANQAAMAQNTAQMSLPGSVEASGQNIIPLLHRAEKPGVIHLSGDEMNHEIAATLADSWEKGYDAIMLKNYRGGKSIVVVKDPSQLRSPHARFDPEKKNSANLLAGITGAAVTAPALYDSLTSRRD